MTVHTTEQLENPLREGLPIERTPAVNAMVIFGASGDLTYRKLLPSLYDLAFDRLLPAGFSVIGFAHHDMDSNAFCEHLREGVERFARRPIDEDVWQSFADGISYVQGDFKTAEDYRPLANEIDRVERERGTMGNRLFYLATPPQFYEPIVKQIGELGLNCDEPRTWQRLIVEKPFGRDLESAHHLNEVINTVFHEQNVFRIDHYLGKETVQNIMAFRFANGIYEPLWSRHFIDHVQITVAETIGIEGRGAYYEQSGAIRDMLQNHMMQLLSLVAMEPPVTLDADAVRDEKVKVLHSVRPIKPESIAHDTVRAQYESGYIAGRKVPGYREENRVDPNSTTETYVAMKMLIDTWRWAEVPFFLRTGKRLPKRVTEIAIQFRPVPHRLFGPGAIAEDEPNVLVLEIQPNEGINLKFKVKVPGPTVHLRPVNMAFQYGSTFNRQSPDAYERLLLDAMLGDNTLFTRRDEVETAWKIVDQIVEGWAQQRVMHLPTYEAGTWGPADADKLISEHGARWRSP